MICRVALLVALALVVGGCKSGSSTRLAASPYSNGKQHSEPVFFNGKHYKVAFRYRPGANVYDVTVAGKGGRPLGGGPGDRKVVEEIGSSAVRHFACAQGQKSHIVPGSSRHTGRAWKMAASCA